MFKGTLKDILTNVVAFISGAIGLVQAVFMVWNTWLASATSEPTVTEWIQLAILIAVAIVGWFTGKNGDGTPKV
jgi:hypothetical protein